MRKQSKSATLLLPVEFNFENIQNSVQKIDFKLRFMQIVIIPVTFNTVYWLWRSYELTNSTNLQTCTEKELFNYDSFFTRLAEEAATHNVAVNVIALPFNYCNLSLTQLAPLCVKTSGTMLYNKPAYYVQNIQKTGKRLVLIKFISLYIVSASFA
ncbi:Sec24 [Hexamita inflata]|uniref:Sec24 n=1 Tax=Hexamita inflata TaxID=28002 RepID=A0ABP1GH32_9EUKA